MKNIINEAAYRKSKITGDILGHYSGPNRINQHWIIEIAVAFRGAIYLPWQRFVSFSTTVSDDIVLRERFTVTFYTVMLTAGLLVYLPEFAARF